MLRQKISPIYSGILLGGSILLISVLLYFVYQSSEPLIKESIEQNRLAKFDYFLNQTEYDNNLLKSAIEFDSLTIYPAYKGSNLVMIFIESTSEKGYSGDIDLITVLTDFDQKPFPKVVGLAITSHRETPGLGDKIERRKSDWILQFGNKNISNLKQLNLKNQGGDFDSLTGATISSRAVIEELKKVLLAWQKFSSNHSL